MIKQMITIDDDFEETNFLSVEASYDGGIEPQFCFFINGKKNKSVTITKEQMDMLIRWYELQKLETSDKNSIYISKT